jgi:hypothetical protein
MADLSPAAQAVLDAYGNEVGWPRPYKHERHGLAAALRAAADQVKRGPDHWDGSMPDDYDIGWNDGVRYLLAIANELDLPNS